jgi:hypothetical protein
VSRLVSPSLGYFLVSLLLFASRVSAGIHACSSSNDFSLGEHPPKPSLGIHLFELNVRPEFPMRTMERLRERLAEDFRARLMKSGYFGSVSLLADDSEESTDFTMIGAFTQAVIGSNDFSLYNIMTLRVVDKPSEISIVGGILKAKDGDPVTTFHCQLWCCKSEITPGIPAPLQTGLRKIEGSISQVAEQLEATYARYKKEQTRAGRK